LKTIQELPEIKDYIAKAHSQLPINNKGKYCMMRICIHFLFILVAKFGGKVIERK
jgi:hypothetical protein